MVPVVQYESSPAGEIPTDGVEMRWERELFLLELVKFNHNAMFSEKMSMGGKVSSTKLPEIIQCAHADGEMNGSVSGEGRHSICCDAM
jgi:hypothetical protein